jgi:hypothetical protein
MFSVIGHASRKFGEDGVFSVVKSCGSTSRTGLPISLAKPISARTPTDDSQPGSISTHTSLHWARNALS